MRSVSSPLLTVNSAPREAVYRALTDNPGQTWTVRTLHQAAAETANVYAEAVRTTVYLLLADGIVEPVPGARALTVRLTTDGTAFLASTLHRWAQATTAPTTEQR